MPSWAWTLTGFGLVLATVLIAWRQLHYANAGHKLAVKTHEQEAADAAARSLVTLDVRLAGGFEGNPQHVRVHATVTHAGQRDSPSARHVVVTAAIGDADVASSQPVDLAPGASTTIDLDIPRQYVVSLQGEGPSYTGTLRLRARDATGATASWSA